MSLLDLLPLDLENIIFDYKIGLESYLKQKARMKKCCKKIKKIKHSYEYIEEDETYETTVIKKDMEVMYYIHKHDGHFDEIETSYIDGNGYYKYYLFENDKLAEYTENDQI